MSRFEIKIVLALLVVAVIPLVASVLLVGQIVGVSDSVAEGQRRRLLRPLSDAAGAYRALFAARKRTFRLQADLVSNDRPLWAAIAAGNKAKFIARLQSVSGQQRGLGELVVHSPDGQELMRWRKQPGYPKDAYRDLQITRGVAGGRRLTLTYFTSREPFAAFAALGKAQRASREIAQIRGDLGGYYRTVFLLMFGAVICLTMFAGVLIARRATRQVTALARATQQVADGNFETSVKITARDELGELSRAFNEMVGQLKENRERIGYLEKIGAWQDIARRLAHEIKNPLTPIQLAMQQVCEKYDGDNAAFRKLLDDANDIVSEEIDGLRRLVVAFSAFARLPRVQPDPVGLDILIDDFIKSHIDLAQRIKQIDWRAPATRTIVLVDRMLIKHVLFNLVENAVQAAEEAGTADALTVVIRGERDNARQRLWMYIADNGPGMTADVLRRIFDPYYTTKDTGTGLGLAIVKKIVLEHGGTIRAVSQPGRGTEFSFSVPLIVDEKDEDALRTTLSRILKTTRSDEG